MAAYYNEFEPFAAAWLRELIKAGMIPDGDVDERDIREVQPEDLRGYTQCHFFAGIGGWAYALRLTGWSDERPVWTGSPPCQPFSVAGKGLGKQDERHLAPVWLELVRAVRPPVLFGEQVAAAVTKDAWLDDLLDALEGAGYATGAAVTPACGVGAPHIRQRLWFVAQRLDDSASARHDGAQSWTETEARDEARLRVSGEGCGASGLGDGIGAGLEGHARHGDSQAGWQEPGRSATEAGDDNHWTYTVWIECSDGKRRPVPTQPEIFPLADGIPKRMGLLRGAGNAIVPQVGAEVIRAFIDN